MALAWLHATGIPWEDDLPPVRYAASLADQPIPPLKVLGRQLESGLNAPLTSSMGRLFDAAAALVGVRQTVNYEAQAAIEMEVIANMREPGYYPMALEGELIDPAPMLHGMIADLRNGVSQPILAARFHSGIAQMVLDTCLRLRKQFDIDEVALSGGVWQNTFLLSLTVGLLQENEFKVYLHRQVPTNDGGLALGQAVVAIARLQSGHL
jgi:hydrogenase maturation protein HypF